MKSKMAGTKRIPTKPEPDVLKELRQKLRGKSVVPKAMLNEKDLKLVYDFAEQIVKQFGGFIQGIVLFGSSARTEGKKKINDIDVLVLVDDVTWQTTQELIGSWRLGVGKILVDLEAVDKLHITTLGITQFWDGVRHADPVIVTLLRDSVPIVDTGFFKPMKRLLELGRIRPSAEAIEAHIKRAKGLLIGVDTHLLVAVDDLYWSTIDAANAALMAYNIPVPAPGQTARLFKNELSKKVHINKQHAKTIDLLYKVMKDILKRKKKKITPQELSEYQHLVEKLVKDVEGLIDKKEKEISKI